MKYFVTGATGFIGGRLAQKLRADGHEVIALVRSPAKAAALKELGIALAEGDITHRASLRDPMTGVDGVFHVAAWYKIGAPDKHLAYDINVNGTRNVLETMRDLGIPKGVYTSTLAIFSDTHGQMADENYRFTGRHLSEYDRTKALAHYEVALPMMQAGLPLVIVQPGAVYGPGDQSDLRGALVQYLKRQLPIIPGGLTLCWAHVDDIVQGHIWAMEKGRIGETYIIAGYPHTFAEVLKLAEQITGIRAPRLTAPPALLKLAAGIMGVLENILPLHGAYTAEGLRASAGVTYLGDNRKARRELGYAPRPLADGLPETLAYEMKLLGIMPKR